MLENGVKETADSIGLTAFDWAAVEGHDSILHFLLQLNPEYSKATDIYGRTALHHASKQGYTKVVRVLLDSGADPSALDALNITPLMAAASCEIPDRALNVIGKVFFYFLVSWHFTRKCICKVLFKKKKEI
ncbi:unnamed protein product [Gongylonema pulchrum]|uniref:Uncharacterized protein n=1 Tax=Gongylonema pulchrum TaxID=637853 RepID=A0A3P7P539_9BILA|nr:unnamed protein product [Gongylonema pulchrum]